MTFRWIRYFFAVVLICNTTKGWRTIRSYAALGDSYAAGDGAGSSRLLPDLDSTCGRFSEAYPIQIAEHLEISRDWFHFRDAACGGATTKTIEWNQIFKMTGMDLVTIQVGGNEVDFFPVLNECIQQWHPFSSCDEELARARGLTQSSGFIEAFDHMVKLAVRAKSRNAVLLILGYARFFNAETAQCNNVTFSLTNTTNFLSNERRHDLNALVEKLNDVIRASAEAHGVTYVDVDEVFEGHRFCEESVIEPHPDWDRTWFFRETPELKESVSNARAVVESPGGNRLQHTLSNPFSKFVDLTKTFHPSIEGHAAIADEVYSVVKRKSLEG